MTEIGFYSRKFREDMIRWEMVDLQTKGFVEFSKKRLLAVFGGDRFAKSNREKLLELLPAAYTPAKIIVLDKNDTIVLVDQEHTRSGNDW